MDRRVLHEMGAIDLKDRRRNDRACRVLESLAAVGDSTPDAFRNVAEHPRLVELETWQPKKMPPANQTGGMF